MNIDYRSLRSHLTGQDVPRHIIGQVLNLFKNLPKDINEVYMTLDRTRRSLDEIAKSCPQLNPRQSDLVRKSHLVLYGNKSTLSKQLEKDLSAIAKPAIRDADWMPYWGTIKKGLRGIGKCNRISVSQVEPIYRTLWEKYSSSEPIDKANMEEHTKAVVAKSQKRFHQELEQYAQLPDRLRNLPVWDKVFTGLHLVLVEPDRSINTLVGYASVTQEPGMKLRLFASPYLLYQCALEPLKRRLKIVLGGVAQDCYLDQEKGAEWAQNQLLEGNCLYSYDLSSATHLFPWAVQVKCLQQLEVPKAVLDLYTHVSKGAYRFMNHKLEWKSGQPLGTGPSFFAFSIAHHALIRGICYDLKVDVDCYRVLGDDIIISNGRVAERYRELIGKLGASINLTKSIISNANAEFAGFKITPNERYQVGKLRPITHNNWYEYSKRFTNLSVFPKESQQIRKTVTEFYAFKPSDGLSNVMDPDVHDFITIMQANAAAENLKVPETIQAWDFANIVTSKETSRANSAYSTLFDYYHRKMEALADELVSYLPEGSWVKNMHKASHRIIFGTRDLLLELAMCPHHCCPIWAHQLTEERGFDSTKEDTVRFLRIRRTLFQVATAYRLMRPPLWMIRGDKFAQKIHKWGLLANKHKLAGTLNEAIYDLREKEAMARVDKIRVIELKVPGDTVDMVFNY